MTINSISLAAIILALSASTHATVISIDWKITGDNLITRDTDSGLDWLDLTETNNMTYFLVSSQLGAGGQFYGWRYATNNEAVTLWSNFNVDVSIGLTIEPIDPGIVIATGFLGNTYNEESSTFSHGLLGLTGDLTAQLDVPTVGAWYYKPEALNVYSAPNDRYQIRSNARISMGSYLVRDVPTVPVPAAFWLFGSGLIGLVGFTKCKKV
jgi:hypothetical protein